VKFLFSQGYPIGPRVGHIKSLELEGAIKAGVVLALALTAPAPTRPLKKNRIRILLYVKSIYNFVTRIFASKWPIKLIYELKS
jgi:hypothetical protein